MKALGQRSRKSDCTTRALQMRDGLYGRQQRRIQGTQQIVLWPSLRHLACVFVHSQCGGRALGDVGGRVSTPTSPPLVDAPPTHPV